MIVQKPMFYLYFVGPAIIFTVDKMISLSRKRMEISIVRAENLASGTNCKILYLNVYVKIKK
jgi:dual oxidase